jgi:hypothetical protein
MTDREPQQALFDLALYLVCSARLAVEENLGLASFRLTEAASRLIAAAPALGVDAGEFLAGERETIDVEKLRVMHDLDGYVAALDGIQARFVAESKRRDQSGSSGNA